MQDLNQLKNKLKTIEKINILDSEEEKKISNYFLSKNEPENPIQTMYWLGMNGVQ